LIVFEHLIFGRVSNSVLFPLRLAIFISFDER